MKKQSKIDWVDATGNPVRGITRLCPFAGPYGDTAALRFRSKVARNASEPKQQPELPSSLSARVRLVNKG
jgi:hypothetical protein